jgi:UDP-N-acetylglucosamine--N-acetylmuramyl-(pentapeptide) pyrophosphoryl-undecaprenol N-acetylglucosamine transferase
VNVLFHAIDGLGLGHLNRTLVMARALRMAAGPLPLTVRFVVDSPAVGLVSDAGFPVVKLPQRNHPRVGPAGRGRRPTDLPRMFEALFAAWTPDHLVVDFVADRALFAAARARGIQVSVVLRRQRRRALLKLALHPAAAGVDRWLLPHSAAEFAPSDLPRPWRSRAVQLGPVVRALDPDAVSATRDRYGADGTKLVVLTLGGGGSPESLPTLQATRAAVASLRGLGPVRAVLLCGPFFPGPLPPDSAQLLHRRFDPDVPSLLAAADAVVCHAGYNTIRELRQSGTPGVIVPLHSTGRDDQARRARLEERDGRAVVSLARPDALAAALHGILAHGHPPRRPATPEPDAATLGTTLLLSLQRPPMR